LVESIGRQDGYLGVFLSQGSAAASKKLADEAIDYAMQVKGLELGYHHPQEARGMEITYATNPRGGVHTEAPDVYGREKESYEMWAAEIARTADQSGLANSYVLCMFNCTPLGVPFLAEVVNAVTGQDWSEDSLTRAAERGWYLKRTFNLLCGAGLEADTMPKRILKQLKEAAVDHADFDLALQSYYLHRQLDAAGLPSKEKLLELDLTSPIEELYGG
jgi:aldehyde:ferredoxin oxidoreductase